LPQPEKGVIAVVVAALGGGFYVLPLIGLVLGIWALVDAASRPEWAWQASRQNKVLWIVLNIVGLLICLFIPIAYLLAIRPKVAAAQSGGGPGGGIYGGGAGPFGSGGYGSGYGAPPGGGFPSSPGGGFENQPGGGYSGAPSGPQAASPPAGWYPDPDGSGQLRYWDGGAWTNDLRPQ
jgi:hypothetical protein